jgi:hypothetical protein
MKAFPALVVAFLAACGGSSGPTDPVPNSDRDSDGIANSQDSCPDQAEVANNFADGDGCPDSIQDLISFSTTDINVFWQTTFQPAGAR